MKLHDPGPYGVIAAFADKDGLLAAIHGVRASGWTEIEAYTPLPVHEVIEALGHETRLPWIVLGGGVTGALVGLALQYWLTVVSYPINVGGRPLASWPSFMIITFELTILFAALAAVLGMFALNKMPMPYHPVFNAPEFQRASRDRFFLMILRRDPRWDEVAARNSLEAFQPMSVHEVPR